MKPISIFPTLVWEDHIDVHKDYPQYVYNLQRDDPEGLYRSNRNGWHSKIYDGMPYVQDQILSLAKIVADEHSYPNTEPYICQSWYNIATKQSLNLPHQHPQSFLSGVYYIKVSDNAGPLKFHRDPLQAYIIQSMHPMDTINGLNAPSAAFKPENGKLYLFPSWLMHSVDLNDDEEDRISLAFSIGL